MECTIDRITVSAYIVPTDFPESDGTFEWDSTTMIVVEARAANESGLGYTYGDLSVGSLIQRTFVPLLEGTDALAMSAAWTAMNKAVRNVGRPGIGTMAIAAVDCALWDLKARLLKSRSFVFSARFVNPSPHMAAVASPLIPPNNCKNG
jgi:L-alanine-DL-glutamate epimerase-like enolase superfamily enzyme